ncbi:MAG: putative bifunctional diguanylate cyclase/phosphodiesterase [Bacteroidota bacterium]
MFENACDGIFALDEQGCFISINRAGQRMLGFSLEAILGKNLRELIPLDYLPLYEGMMQGLWSEQSLNRFEMPVMTGEGRRITLENSVRIARGDGTPIAQVIARDITERKQLEEKLDYLAFNDALTGLPNRVLFHDRLGHALAHAKRYGTQVAIGVMDLDRFKQINDILGHDAGDRLLYTVSRRLASQMRAVDSVARVGGDEFYFLFSEIRDPLEAQKAASRILNLFSTPIAVGENELYVTPSVGISLYPTDGDDPATLLKHADIAMYAAKALGKNNVQFFQPSMREDQGAHDLEKNLRRALSKGELRVYYQPQYDLKENKLVGMEALLRWHHPTLGVIPPLQFVPIAEEIGLIVPIGEWVMRQACAQTKAWQEMGLPPVKVSINLSPRQFHHPGIDLPDVVGRILAETGLEPRYLELEITEGLALKHLEETVQILHRLHALGVTISIDDFGTGYSSLSYLKKFPIDTLKIDRSFVKDIEQAGDAAIVKAILAMARALKLFVIAEGVENEHQRDFLREQGCNLAQGFLFSQAVPAAEFEGFLRETR